MSVAQNRWSELVGNVVRVAAVPDEYGIEDDSRFCLHFEDGRVVEVAAYNAQGYDFIDTTVLKPLAHIEPHQAEQSYYCRLFYSPPRPIKNDEELEAMRAYLLLLEENIPDNNPNYDDLLDYIDVLLALMHDYYDNDDLDQIKGTQLLRILPKEVAAKHEVSALNTYSRYYAERLAIKILEDGTLNNEQVSKLAALLSVNTKVFQQYYYPRFVND